jgi:hypothetical protein
MCRAALLDHTCSSESLSARPTFVTSAEPHGPAWQTSCEPRPPIRPTSVTVATVRANSATMTLQPGSTASALKPAARRPSVPTRSPGFAPPGCPRRGASTRTAGQPALPQRRPQLGVRGEVRDALCVLPRSTTPARYGPVRRHRRLPPLRGRTPQPLHRRPQVLSLPPRPPSDHLHRCELLLPPEPPLRRRNFENLRIGGGSVFVSASGSVFVSAEAPSPWTTAPSS